MIVIDERMSDEEWIANENGGWWIWDCGVKFTGSRFPVQGSDLIFPRNLNHNRNRKTD